MLELELENDITGITITGYHRWFSDLTISIKFQMSFHQNTKPLCVCVSWPFSRLSLSLSADSFYHCIRSVTVWLWLWVWTGLWNISGLHFCSTFVHAVVDQCSLFINVGNNAIHLKVKECKFSSSVDSHKIQSRLTDLVPGPFMLSCDGLRNFKKID